jgi:hypothetical protein
VVTPEQIRHTPLAGVGPFGRAYVRALLATVADRMAALEAELAAARRAVRLRELEIEQRRYGVVLPGSRFEQVHDEQILRSRMEAQRFSDDITAAAQQQAAEIVEAAQRQAERIYRGSLPDGSGGGTG